MHFRLTHCSLDPHRSALLNGISIASAIFAGLNPVPNIQKDTQIGCVKIGIEIGRIYALLASDAAKRTENIHYLYYLSEL